MIPTPSLFFSLTTSPVLLTPPFRFIVRLHDISTPDFCTLQIVDFLICKSFHALLASASEAEAARIGRCLQDLLAAVYRWKVRRGVVVPPTLPCHALSCYAERCYYLVRSLCSLPICPSLHLVAHSCSPLLLWRQWFILALYSPPLSLSRSYPLPIPLTTPLSPFSLVRVMSVHTERSVRASLARPAPPRRGRAAAT